MTFKELFAQEPFAKIFEEVEVFSERKLGQYILTSKTTKEVKEAHKEIFDAVWGNIEFSGGEIVILDSPLLQRLRKIKQLGLAYYVYCGCDYSRYYHTLGVVYLADRMANTINRCSLPEKDKIYFKAVVRLAAIFHDVGHMFLSHVSEHYFAKSQLYPRSDEIAAMLEKFERKAGRKAALHELLSCMIVNTTAVHKLLAMAVPAIEGLTGKSGEDDICELVEYMSSLIVGVPVDRRVLPYSSIINGPIDADKCDYLSRDSHVTRVPVAVDISRLTQKLSVVRTEDINTSLLWHENADTSIPCYELAMQDSAEKALFQLCIARTIMFDSVYYHHKVLTAETECRRLINELSNLDKKVFTSFTEILEHTDEDFNRYFFDSLKRERGEDDCRRIEELQTSFGRIFNRRLAKRVVCIMPDYLVGKQSDTETFFDNVITRIDSDEEKELIDNIKHEYARIRELLGCAQSGDQEINIFMIQAPTQVFWHSKIQVPIDLRNGNKRDFRGYELVSSRETSSSSSYIVTDEEDRLLVYLAIEKVLYRIYHIRMKEESLTCGKFDKKEIDKRYAELYRKGYYNDAAELISNNTLYNYISKTKIQKIVSRFSSYEGPDGYKVTEPCVECFFKQILSACKNKDKSNAVTDGINRMLNSALFLNRQYVTDNLRSIVNRFCDKDTKKLCVVPLGRLLDSAMHMSYFWNDIKLPDIEIIVETDLEEVLKKEDTDQIVFFDDGAYSGTQLISIMQEYMGVEKNRTEEEHVKPLDANDRQVLRNKKIIFFFLVFNQSKEKELREELGKLGIQKVKFEYVQDLGRSRYFEREDSIFEDEEQSRLVKELLEEVGLSIIKSEKTVDGGYKKKWSEKRVREAALGYNDAQQMVILKSSVPTYTITAFWAKGQYNGQTWKPLFRRTDKP